MRVEPLNNYCLIRSFFSLEIYIEITNYTKTPPRNGEMICHHYIYSVL